MGLLVCAIDIDDGKLAHATHLGADLVINAKTGDPATAVKKATGGGAHGVLITAPSLIAFKQGVGMTRKRGTCVLVGLPPGEFPVPLFDVVANCITIRGSFVGTRQDMAEALAFAVVDFAPAKTKKQRSEQDQQFATAGASSPRDR
jgi:propanol-preferring alcohol dehydrogenase